MKSDPDSADCDRVVSIPVRDLVSFVWRRGGLSLSSEGRLPDRALRGTRAHQEIQGQRPKDYVAEMSLRYERSRSGILLRVHGRVDGLFPDRTPVEIEEIKTVTRAWRGRPSELHWAQLRFYAAVYAEQRDLDEVAMTLTYFDLDSQRTTPFCRTESRSDLDVFLQETLNVYWGWLERYQEWAHERDASVASLRFPFVTVRAGQPELMDEVSRAVTKRRRLFVEAATGLGKTMAVLYPVVRQLQVGVVDQIYFLSAKNSGKEAAVKALETLRQQGARLRSLNLRSKQSTCVRDGRPCETETCPLAKDYYQNQKPAMAEALEREHLDYSGLAEIGEAHQVCPFELALDLLPFCDVVVCDYNYVFDRQLALRRTFQSGSSQWIALVDECHNLVERGREIYSGALPVESFQSLMDQAGRWFGGLRRHLKGVVDLLSPTSQTKAPPVVEGQLSWDWAEVGAPADGSPARRLDSEFLSVGLPDFVLNAFQRLIREIEELLATGVDLAFEEPLLDLYFELLRWIRLSEFEPNRFRFFLEGRRDPTLHLVCLDPAPMLRESMDWFRSTVCFSGTLHPVAVYRQLLGGEPSDPSLQLDSPFNPNHLRVSLHTGIDTRYRYRIGSEQRLAQVILEMVSEEKGAYLVFFPSYEYQSDVLRALRERLVAIWGAVDGDEVPEREQRSGGSGRIPMGDRIQRSGRFAVDTSRATLRPAEGGLSVSWQVPGMDEVGRDRFLDGLFESTNETAIGFGVLGGSFGEGLDIEGNRLKGVIVVGVGYPMISRQRELIQAYFEGLSGNGFDVAYLIPGMNRVIQACGRVIRRESDKGRILLIDRRYSERIYRSLLPQWWSIVQGGEELPESA